MIAKAFSNELTDETKIITSDIMLFQTREKTLSQLKETGLIQKFAFCKIKKDEKCKRNNLLIAP